MSHREYVYQEDATLLKDKDKLGAMFVHRCHQAIDHELSFEQKAIYNKHLEELFQYLQLRYPTAEVKIP